MGTSAHLPFPLGPMAPAPISAPSIWPQGLYGLLMWGREPGLLLPGPKAWRRDAPFICALAPPSFIPQPRTLSGHKGRGSRTAAAPSALCRASTPPSPSANLLDCGCLVASVSGLGRLIRSSANASGLLHALRCTSRFELAGQVRI